jgi:MSHA pilin protein MshC
MDFMPRHQPSGVRLSRITRRSGGFTMVELIMVIVLIGILGAIGAARFFSRTGFDAAAYAEQGAGMLRYAQKLAIAQNRQVFVQSSTQGLRLCYSAADPCAANDRVITPAGSNSGNSATKTYCAAGGAYVQSWYCEAVPTGATMTLGSTAAATFYFNALGRPYLSTDAGLESTFTGQTLTITGDGLTRTVSVAQETGYVY